MTAPDATAGDGLRDDAWWTRVFLAVQELVDSVPYADGSKYPVPHAAAFRAAVEPALRDVLAAAARDAERVARVRDVHEPDGSEPHACCECGEAWPCCTIQALDGPQ